MQPASGIADDVVDVQIEDIDFTKGFVVDDEVAALSARIGIAQALRYQTGLEFRPVGVRAVHVGLRDDEVQPLAFLVTAEHLEIVVEETIAEQQVSQVVVERLGGERVNVRDFEDSTFSLEVSHSMLLAAAHRIGFQ
jgi:hypothetical protein